MRVNQCKAWSPYSCNGRKHRCKHVSDSVPSSFDTREHFDYNIASLTGIVVINCSVSSSCNDRSNHWRHVSSLVSSCIANLNQRDMGKQLPTPLRLIARMNFLLKNYSCELFNWPERSGKWNLFQLLLQLVAKAGMWMTNTLGIMLEILIIYPWTRI